MGPSAVLGKWGELLFIFRELGSTGNYIMGAREQAHNLGDLGSLAKKEKDKEKPPFCLIFFKTFFPQTTLVNSQCIYFRTNMLIYIDQRENMAISFFC